jgi:hypothetical protein
MGRQKVTVDFVFPEFKILLVFQRSTGMENTMTHSALFLRPAETAANAVQWGRCVFSELRAWACLDSIGFLGSERVLEVPLSIPGKTSWSSSTTDLEPVCGTLRHQPNGSAGTVVAAWSSHCETNQVMEQETSMNALAGPMSKMSS